MEMKGKLIKVLDQYHLYNGDKPIATTIVCNPMLLPILSLKNCEAIANGYDLDELADEHCNKLYHEGNINWDRYRIHFKLGFQKALEILGDKKFSKEDLKACWEVASDVGWNRGNDHGESEIANYCFEDYTQTLQQTEFDVEVELVCPHPLNTYVCGMQYGCDGDGCNHPNQIPYLDKDGCLILKRI